MALWTAMQSHNPLKDETRLIFLSFLKWQMHSLGILQWVCSLITLRLLRRVLWSSLDFSDVRVALSSLGSEYLQKNMKLISLCSCLYLQCEPNVGKKTTTTTNNRKKTSQGKYVYFGKMTQNCWKRSGTIDYNRLPYIVKKIDVNCLRLYNFVLKSVGGFGDGEESFQRIACRRMNL